MLDLFIKYQDVVLPYWSIKNKLLADESDENLKVLIKKLKQKTHKDIITSINEIGYKINVTEIKS